VRAGRIGQAELEPQALIVQAPGTLETELERVRHGQRVGLQPRPCRVTVGVLLHGLGGPLAVGQAGGRSAADVQRASAKSETGWSSRAVADPGEADPHASWAEQLPVADAQTRTGESAAGVDGCAGTAACERDHVLALIVASTGTGESATLLGAEEPLRTCRSAESGAD
jgi:hypothetical protein